MVKCEGCDAVCAIVKLSVQGVYMIDGSLHKTLKPRYLCGGCCESIMSELEAILGDSECHSK